MNLLEQLTGTIVLPEKYKQMTVHELEEGVREIKRKMGARLFIPGHHYQKDEVIQFADSTGDSFKLAQLSATNMAAEFIVFCGVHFMAETADILTRENQRVFLPDMRAGCSMADMADIHQTKRAWGQLQKLYGDTILPLTYINSTAAIKAFVGANGGATVTSSNAKTMVKWAFAQKERILFLPDQHLGRNTAAELGVGIDEMAIWNPIQNRLEFEGDSSKVKVILWQGHCSVHQNFTVENCRETRRKDPDRKIIVHPECSREVVEMADLSGSTSFIINTIETSEPGTKWAIGTEMNLVNRLIKQHRDKEIISLNPYMCPCMTMNRIDLPHLLWCLETLEESSEHNRITVSKSIAFDAKLTLERMLMHA